MVGCSSYGCTNRTSDKSVKQRACETRKRITFHLFPKDPERRKCWVEALQRDNLTPTDNTVVCSLHFEDDCFDRSLPNITKLKNNAVPTIFTPLPISLQKASVPPRSPIKQEVPNATPSPFELEIKTEEYLGITTELPAEENCSNTRTQSTSTSPELQHTVESPVNDQLRIIIKNDRIKYQKKIKILQQTVRRQSKKLCALKKVVQLLRSNNILIDDDITELNNVVGRKTNLDETCS